MAAAAKCEASGCRQKTYVPSARGAALSELACPADAPARGDSHRGAALGRQGRAGQGKLDSWRCRARPSLAARTGPSSSAAHKPMARRPLPRAGLPRPRGGRGGHRGVGGEPRAATKGLPGAACGGRTHAWLGDPRTGTSCRCATQDFLGSSVDSAPFPGLQTMFNNPYRFIKHP